MHRKQRLWLLIALLIALSGAVFYTSYRSRAGSDPASLLARLPPGEAVVVHLDFRALRDAGLLGLLARSAAPEEADYKAFVGKTGFDYKSDLDSALVSFHPSGTFFLVKGRFDWGRLNDYVTSQRGSCSDDFCRMQGSTAERRISFFALNGGLMALAVSSDEWAAAQLRQVKNAKANFEIPPHPAWMMAPPAALKRGDLPAAAGLFARSMEDTEGLTLSLTTAGGNTAMLLDVRCRSDQDAAKLAAQLESVTALLRDLMVSEKQKPNPAELSGLLTSGVFSAQGTRVTGKWPIEQAFLEQMLGGG